MTQEGFLYDSQGPDYGVHAWVGYTSTCGMMEANIAEIEGGCNINGLGRQAIDAVLASAKGEQVLVPACGGGLMPFIEGPAATAQKPWELPRSVPVLR